MATNNYLIAFNGTNLTEKKGDERTFQNNNDENSENLTNVWTSS
ncbi:hypothetical protein [Trichococcus collinsii]|nr:hypothetical protein [Trichococcus collinsii]